MSLEKITVEIESSYTNTTCCHLWFLQGQLSVLFSPKQNSSRFEAVYIQVQKKEVSKYPCLLKTLYIKESWKNWRQFTLKEVITVLRK